MEPPEQFKREYMNNKFKLQRQVSQVSLTNGNSMEELSSPLILEDTPIYSSPYSTQITEKEASFVARILHVGVSFPIDIISYQ